MQRVREQNHEVSQFVNNPDLMCQTMEMIRIPTTIQEITRNHDRALINLERLPSGYKVRQRIYRDFQEPMLNVAHEQFGDNPLNTYSSSSGTANTSQVGTENTNLLPNPKMHLDRARLSQMITVSNVTMSRGKQSECRCAKDNTQCTNCYTPNCSNKILASTPVITGDSNTTVRMNNTQTSQNCSERITIVNFFSVALFIEIRRNQSDKR
ncbi:hypothetical protein GJ496_001007 [Pomphorhynchus laevis]|nr:hypothetical protein GJ496_001007 [Pomphorhynchus laevis]